MENGMNFLSLKAHITQVFSSSVQIVKDGKKRKLVINGCKLEDAGKITCATNADESSADLGVKCKNKRKTSITTNCHPNNDFLNFFQ